MASVAQRVVVVVVDRDTLGACCAARGDSEQSNESQEYGDAHDAVCSEGGSRAPVITNADACLANLSEADGAKCGTDTDTFDQSFVKVAAVLCGPPQ